MASRAELPINGFCFILFLLPRCLNNVSLGLDKVWIFFCVFYLTFYLILILFCVCGLIGENMQKKNMGSEGRNIRTLNDIGN